MGFSFEEGDVIAIDESIGYEVFQPSNPERSLKIIHDSGTILVKASPLSRRLTFRMQFRSRPDQHRSMTSAPSLWGLFLWLQQFL